ncbi:MAG: type I pullulanase [Clostridia bacterium]|nr:type I pullulanase [Clostridia bacterium]
MTKRILSLVLVLVMLLGICISTASCAYLEGIVGEENLGDEYMDKYYPDRNTGTGNGENNDGEVDNTLNEHASYAEKKDGYNLITFYWNNTRADANKCDLWAWWDGDGGDGKGYIWEKCSYGYRVTLSVPDSVTEVGFIPRKDCTEPGGNSWGYALKDCGEDDLFAIIEGEDTFIYLRGGKNDANQYHSNDGGKTLQVIQKFNLAGIIDRHTIEYYVTPATKLTNASQVKIMDGDKEIAVTKVTNLNKSSNTGKITVDADLDITKNYTIHIDGYGENNVVPTKIFDTDWFAENYHYDGTDLGATINGDGTTTFKVWAPTASKVVLNLYKDGDKNVNSAEDKKLDMTRGDKGVWSYTAEAGHGTFFTYSVTTSVGTQEAVDPYAKAAGVNGDRGMVVDLSLTNPEGWADDVKNFNTGIDSYSDAIIWEIHIRDFSNTINFGSKDANEKYQGKYLAFTQEGLVNEHGVPVGIDYLKALGVNFVHLLPSYDYATVKEHDPDSGFNWGYDPKNYNVPEGSYSTDPFNGAVRIKEYKEMVMALHEAGIGVIMDVVYNHTFDKNASFNRIVPYYYYRYKANGANSSGSGCGNDTASERYMYGKFMVESVSYWQQEYNLDGFRFDLMGLHDMNTMQRVESAVHTYDPQAIIYGEGWEMMKEAYNGAISANAGNIKSIVATNGAIGTIAVFNDTTRVGLKGEADDPAKNGYINGNTSLRAKVLFGINGGVGASAGSWWTVNNAMVVNYLSAHDNSTLWDKLTFSNKGATLEQRLAMNRLGATILHVSKGIVFYQAGEEILRSKPNSKSPTGYDHNSYKSSDEINNLKWDTLKPGSNEYKMFQYYAGLSAIRTKFDIFTNNTKFIASEHGYDAGINIVIEDGNGGKALVIINPQSNSMNFDLKGTTYHLVCDGVTAGITSIRTCSGTVTVPGCSAYILVNDQVLNNPKK